MKKLKEKIITEIIKDLKTEDVIILENLKLEKELYENKNCNKKISRLNFLRINYENFKNGDLSLKKFFSKSFFNISPFIFFNGLFLYEILSRESFSISKFDHTLLTLTMLAILFLNVTIYFNLFCLNIVDKETKVRTKYLSVINKIKNINEKKEINIKYVEEVFLNSFDFKDGKEFSEIFNNPINICILNHLNNEFNEEQLKRLFQKTGNKNINYKCIIELIKEIEKTEKTEISEQYYNEVFLVKKKEKLHYEIIK